MDLLSARAARAGSFTEPGVSPPGEAFAGRLVVRPVGAGRVGGRRWPSCRC